MDAILAAVESGDPARVMALVNIAGVACVPNATGVGAPPACLPGQAAGTLAPVFPFPVCEGRYVDRSEVERTLQVFAFAKTPRLYAVFEPAGDIIGEPIRPQYVILWGFEGRQPAGVWSVSVRDSVITGMSYCDRAVPDLSGAGRIILPAP